MRVTLNYIPHPSAITSIIIFITSVFITWLVILLPELLNRNEVPGCVLTKK
jgi:hypothetical protein